MKVSNLLIKNKYINFTGQQVKFDKTGIYYIQGENGSGKSTLIKHLIFEKNVAEFNTELQEKAYHTNRAGLFAYVPQSVAMPDISVEKYLGKEETIDIDKTLQIAKELGLAVTGKQRLKNLSGGEKEKLAIALALQKQTPYIILDEPTNYLDDESTELLCHILEEYSHDKTVIIISHDNRVKFEGINVNHIEISNNTINQYSNDGEYNYGKPIDINKKKTIACAWRFQSNFINILVHIPFLLVMSFIVFMNAITCSTYISDDNIPEPGTVLQYTVEGVYPNINEAYVNYNNYEIAANKRMRTLTYESIGYLYENQYFDELYVFDKDYFEKSLTDYCGEGNKEFSIPAVVWDNYRENLGIDFFWKIIKGRNPKDKEKEIVLDENVAKRLTNSKNIDETLNRNVMINNEEYTIVGISDAPVIWVSYDDKKESGFYKYDKNTWHDYSDKLKNNQESAFNKEIVPHCIFVTDNEKVLLDYLIMNYPASDYYSSIYAEKSQLYNNRIVYYKMVGI